MEEDKFFTMRIPCSLHRKVKECCARHVITMKEFSIVAIMRMLASEKKSEEELTEEPSIEEFLKECPKLKQAVKDWELKNEN